jgi:hypothetical protein
MPPLQMAGRYAEQRLDHDLAPGSAVLLRVILTSASGATCSFHQQVSVTAIRKWGGGQQYRQYFAWADLVL